MREDLQYLVTIPPHKAEEASRALAKLGIRLDPTADLVDIDFEVEPDPQVMLATDLTEFRYDNLDRHLEELGWEPRPARPEPGWPPERTADLLRLANRNFRWDGNQITQTYPGNWAEAVAECPLAFEEKDRPQEEEEK